MTTMVELHTESQLSVAMYTPLYTIYTLYSCMNVFILVKGLFFLLLSRLQSIYDYGDNAFLKR